MSGDYCYVRILIRITLLQNGYLPTLVEETLFSSPADACACALELQQVLEMLGMLSAFKHAQLFAKRRCSDEIDSPSPRSAT